MAEDICKSRIKEEVELYSLPISPSGARILVTKAPLIPQSCVRLWK
jgi:hypothetical protein